MLGNMIRLYRKKRGYTLDTLASKAGISAGGLSQIERGIISPSIAVLQKIAASLNVSINALFVDNIVSFVTRNEERKKFDFPDLNVIYEFLTPRPQTDRETPSFVSSIVTIAPHSWGNHDYEFHDADELFLVLEGKVEVHMFDDRIITLNAMDSIYHSKNVQHRLFNPAEAPAKAISVLSDFVY